MVLQFGLIICLVLTEHFKQREEWMAREEDEKMRDARQDARLNELSAVWNRAQTRETRYGKSAVMDAAKQAKCNQKALTKAFAR